MAVVKCRECKQRVSTEAQRCPHCGAPDPQPERSTSSPIAIVAVVVAVLFTCGLCNSSDESPSGTRAASTASSSATVRPAAPVKSAEEKRAEYVEKLRREYDSLADGIDVGEYTDSKTTIMIGLALFELYAQIADEARQHNLEGEDAELLAGFKRRAIRAQQQALPRLRDAYGPAIRRDLWEHDMEAKTFGSGYRTIEFVGGTFAANRNKQQWQESLQETLMMMRFKQSRYKWYSGASEYTYYTIDSPDDSELVSWSGSRARVIE